MAKKKETGASARVLNSLKRHGYFRKISDRVQVGIPDIIGSAKIRFVGVEVKAVSEVPKNGLVPPKGSHTFDRVQVNNLEEIHETGGLGVGMVVCGKQAVWCYWHQIDESGQINWHQCVEENQHIPDIDDLKRFVEDA